MLKIEKERKSRQLKKTAAVIKLIILLILLIGIPLYLWLFQYDTVQKFSDLGTIKEFFHAYKAESVFAYIGVQILQIIISFLPGQQIQFAAGFLFGFWLGYLYSIIGAAIGTVITYYLAKSLGHDAVHIFFGEEKINRFLHKLNSKKGYIIIMLIYLIPGVPKDLCCYAAGLSEIKLKLFLVLSLVGRTPGMMGSLLIGMQAGKGDYISVIIISAIFIALFILGVIYRKKLEHWLEKLHDKFTSK